VSVMNKALTGTVQRHGGGGVTHKTVAGQTDGLRRLAASGRCHGNRS